jgi:hypothetical protein
MLWQAARWNEIVASNGHDDLLLTNARSPRVGLKEDSSSACQQQTHRWAQPYPRTRRRPIRHTKYSAAMELRQTLDDTGHGSRSAKLNYLLFDLLLNVSAVRSGMFGSTGICDGNLGPDSQLGH